MYNYEDNVYADVLEAIEQGNYDITEYIENNDRDGAFEFLNDAMWCDDSITGNGSGSYTFSTWQAEENLAHNWDVLQEACCEYCCKPDLSSPEAMDVTIRCYYLPQAIEKVLDRYF